MREDEMVGWHQQLNGHEFEQALGAGEGQGSLVCCRESDTTEQLNWTDTQVALGIPTFYPVVKNPPTSTGDVSVGLIPESGRSPGGGLRNLLQYSCMENPHGQRNLVGYNPWGCRVVHDWATTIIIIRIILYSTTYMVSVFPFTFLNLFWICYVFQYKKESIFMLFHVTIQLFLYYLLQWFLFSVYFRCHLGWSN